MKRFEVVPVPVLSDNYAYLLVDTEGKCAAAVDPAEPKKVLAAAKELGVKVVLSLTTHKHWDHAGGNVELSQLLPDLPIVGSAYEDVPGVNKRVKDHETITLGTLDIEALHAPCHTRGHVLYFVRPHLETESPVLFTGDTLFIGGCGRFFEGTGADMVNCMKTISSLPPDSKVYCGHEYTVANLTFAASVEPSNTALQDKLAWAKRQRSMGLPTVPSTISEELLYNPFMRISSEGLLFPESARPKGENRRPDDAQLMTTLRDMKNNFKS